MALRDLFTSQSLNQAFPSRLPGTAKGWDTSSTNREVAIDPSVAATVELLPSNPVKLSGKAGQMKYVQPCTSSADQVYGYIIYKAKNFVNNVGYNRIATVGREYQEMDFAFKTAITAGATAYVDTADGFATNTPSATTVVAGLAVETVTAATAAAPVVACVEIQCPRAVVAAAA